MENPFNARFNFKYLKFLLKRNRVLLLILTISMLFVNPVYIAISRKTQGSIEGISFIAMIFLVIVLLLASIALPPVILSYLNSKRALDVYYAVPIRRINLFFTQYVALILIIWIPFLISFAFGFLVSGYFGFFSTVSVSGIHYLLLYLLLALVVSNVLITISCFVSINTGTTLNSFIYIGLITIVPYILFIAVGIFSSMYLGSYFTLSDNIITFTSPNYVLLEYIGPLFANFKSNTVIDYFDILKTTVFWFVVNFVLLVSSIYLFQKRKHELVEQPFVNTWFGPVVRSISTCIFLFMMLSSFRSSRDYTSVFTVEGLVIPLLFTYIIFIVGIVITNRSFKNIFKSSIQYVLLSAVTISVFAVGIKTGGFGYLYNVPVADRVESIALNYYDNDNSFDYRSIGIKLENKEDIEQVIAIHQAIVDDLQKDNSLNNIGSQSNAENTISLSLTYKYTNRSDYSIAYTINDSEMKIFNELMKINEFKKTVFLALDPLSSFQDSYIVNGDLQAVYLNSASGYDSAKLHQYIIDDINQIGNDFMYSVDNQFVYAVSFFSDLEKESLVHVVIDNRFLLTLDYLKTLNINFSRNANIDVQLFSNHPENFKFFLVDKNSELSNKNIFKFTNISLTTLSNINIYPIDGSDIISSSRISADNFKSLQPYFIGNGISSSPKNKLIIYDKSTRNFTSFMLSDDSSEVFQKLFESGTKNSISIYDFDSYISDTSKDPS